AVRYQPAALVAALRPGVSLSLMSLLAAVGTCMFAAGTAEALGHAASDFPQPKIQHLRRAARFVSGYSLVVTAGLGFFFVWLVPADARLLWHDAPAASLVLAIAAPRWASVPIAAVVAAAAAGLLALAVYRSAVNA